MTAQEMIIIKLSELRNMLEEQGNEEFLSFIDELRYHFIKLEYGIDIGMVVINKENNQIRLVQDVALQLHYDPDDYSALLLDIYTIDCNGKTYIDTVSNLSDRFYTMDIAQNLIVDSFRCNIQNYKGGNNNVK